MSEKHLSTGSTLPPKKDGVVRLYSMKFCPYAQRAHMVLIAKNVPHEVVNINLQIKPEWYHHVNPNGKVPALDDGSKIISESIDICDYIDEKYTDIPMYPIDSDKKAKDKELIASFAGLVTIFSSALFDTSGKTFSEYFKDISPHLDHLESELKERGTVFFLEGGPGMVDFMLWPFAQRFKAIGMFFNDEISISKETYPCLRRWRDEMLKQPAVQKTITTPEQFYKLVCHIKAKEKFDYDSL